MIALWLACHDPVLIEQASVRQSLLRSDTKAELVVEVLLPEGQRADLKHPTSSTLELTEHRVRNHSVLGGRREVWTFIFDGKEGKHIIEPSELHFSLSSKPIEKTERLYVELGKSATIVGLRRAPKQPKTLVWRWVPLLAIGAMVALLLRRRKQFASPHWLQFEELFNAPTTKSQVHELAQWLRLRLEQLDLGQLSALTAAECAERMSRHPLLAHSQRFFLAQFFEQLQQAQYAPALVELDWRGLRSLIEDLEAVRE